jgi:transcriptional regulator with XRE-family HTH domain
MKNTHPEFGRRLAMHRKQLGLTQAELAKKLNISLAMVKYYETKSSNPELTFIRIASNTLGISADDLISGVKKSSPGPQSDLRKRFDRISLLPRKQQKKIMNVVDAIMSPT